MLFLSQQWACGIFKRSDTWINIPWETSHNHTVTYFQLQPWEVFVLHCYKEQNSDRCSLKAEDHMLIFFSLFPWPCSACVLRDNLDHKLIPGNWELCLQSVGVSLRERRQSFLSPHGFSVSKVRQEYLESNPKFVQVKFMSIIVEQHRKDDWFTCWCYIP